MDSASLPRRVDWNVKRETCLGYTFPNMATCGASLPTTALPGILLGRTTHLRGFTSLSIATRKGVSYPSRSNLPRSSVFLATPSLTRAATYNGRNLSPGPVTEVPDDRRDEPKWIKHFGINAGGVTYESCTIRGIPKCHFGAIVPYYYEEPPKPKPKVTKKRWPREEKIGELFSPIQAIL
jgi:hypothetical protein